MVPPRSGRTSRQHHPSRYPSGPSRYPSGEPSPRQRSGQPDHRRARAESRSRDHDLADQGRTLAAPGARRILVLAANFGRGPRSRAGARSRPGTPPGARTWAHQGHGRPRRRPGLPARSRRRTCQPPGGRPVCLAEIAATLECGGNPVGSAIRGRRPAALVLARAVPGAYLAAGSPPAARTITARTITASTTATAVAVPVAEQACPRPPRPVGSAAARPRAHRVARAHAAPARRTGIHRAGSRFR
jgi:hypothetical protein